MSVVASGREGLAGTGYAQLYVVYGNFHGADLVANGVVNAEAEEVIALDGYVEDLLGGEDVVHDVVVGCRFEVEGDGGVGGVHFGSLVIVDDGDEVE
jgi:hypothetical protein